MINDQPTYMGQPANRGEITIEPTYPNEGFAVLKCGNTSVKIGYTMLHKFAPQWAPVGENHPDYPQWKAIRDALHSIICEAAEGGKG